MSESDIEINAGEFISKFTNYILEELTAKDERVNYAGACGSLEATLIIVMIKLKLSFPEAYKQVLSSNVFGEFYEKFQNELKI